MATRSPSIGDVTSMFNADADEPQTVPGLTAADSQ